MDEATAHRLWEAGQEVNLVINGRREDGAFITGLDLPDGYMRISLRTRIGQPDRRIRIHRENVELAP